MVQMPKGLRMSSSTLYFDQLAGLETSSCVVPSPSSRVDRPTLKVGAKRFAGRVEDPLGTHYVFHKKRRNDDDKEDYGLHFHSRVDKVVIFD